jgi:hypothetical protein
MSRRLQAVVVAVMLGMALAAPSMASAQGESDTAPNCEEGNTTAFSSPGREPRNLQAGSSLNKVFYLKCRAN